MAAIVGANNASAVPSSLFSFSMPNFGNGFVELSALTTLIGSSVIEYLILGSGGGAGVAWATMSAFGLLGAMQACAGAACAGWLRNVLGLRSGDSDEAIGMEVASDERGRGAMKIRRSYAEKGPCGLSVDASKFLKSSGEPEASDLKIKWKEIYAFDQLTARALGALPDCKPKDDKILEKSTQLGRNSEIEQIDATPAVYFYGPDPFYPHHNPWFQIPVLLLSTLKVGEGVVLLKLGTGFLGLITLMPWAYFFIVACIIEARELILASRPEVLDGEIDIVIGQFPNMTQSTDPQQGRVIIGAPRNPRKGTWWRVAWVLGTLMCPPTVVILYLSLTQESNKVVSVWLVFQIIWMAGRMLVYYFSESPRETVAVHILYRRAWDTLPDVFKKRVVNLMVALSTYVISVHPRQDPAYRDNASTYRELRRIVIETPTLSNYPLPSDTTSLLNPSNYVITGLPVNIDVEIHAVIGDPTLISVAWIANTPGLTFENLYDTCVLCLKLPPSSNSMSHM